MRNAFARILTEVARENDKITLLSGDIGNRLFDDFKKECAERFFNCGVAEANMISLGAGMGLSGFIPFAYTIAPFITARCLEQIRIDVCYHNVPMVIVAVGSGFSYANNGPTHHCAEDLAWLRVLPNMTLVCPGDALEVEAAVAACANYGKPVYLRLGKKNEPLVHTSRPSFTIGKSIRIQDGSDICILSTGNMLPVAAAAAKLLASQGLSVGVESMHTVKPLDEETLDSVFSNIPLVVSLEEHSLIGGFGSAVLEWCNKHSGRCDTLLRIGSADTFFHEAGDQMHVRSQMGLTAEAVSEKVLKRLKRL